MTDQEPTGVLALDLATVTGWAFGDLNETRPTFGCWRLPYQGGEGMRFAAFENALAEAIIEWNPARIVLESPLRLVAHTRLEITEQQLGLRALAYAEAWRGSVPISEVSADMVRGALLGQSRFAKGTVKREVMKYCNSLGLKVPDHNAGDACMIWLWMRGQLMGRKAAAGPLFRERTL